MPIQRSLSVAAAFVVALASAAPSRAGEGWWSGDWYLTVGAAVLTAPRYDGDDSYLLSAQPLVSLGRAGSQVRFSSRNDNISLGLVDTGAVRAGPTGRIVFPRDSDASDDLAGLDPVRWGVEVGAFAEFYPIEWLRVRGELRRGIRAHDAFVADVAVDAFAEVAPTIRISGGPRVSFAGADYFDAYYGVDAAEAVASGLSPYDPDGGLKSYGVGGAVTWAATDRITTSLFGEYGRLAGPAADSSLVRERGAADQFLLGVSATYRFDFSF